MSAINHRQDLFIGGELTPRLWGRFGSELYQRALELCENWEILPQGGIRNRIGTVHVEELTEGPKARLFKFRRAGAQEYVVVLGDETIRVFGIDAAISGGQVVDQGIHLVPNGNFASGLTGWTVVDPIGVSWAAGLVTLSTYREYDGESGHSYYYSGRITQTVTVADPDTYHVSFQVTSVTGPSARLAVRLLRASDGLLLWQQDIRAAGTYNYDVDLPAGDMIVRATILEDANPLHGDAAITFGNIDIAGVTAPVVSAPLVSPWKEEDLPAVQFAAIPGTDTVYFVHPKYQPHALTYNAGTFALAAIAFTSAPAEWTTNNYPAAIEVFQGRLWLAGTPSQRSTFWASKSGSYTDFGKSTPVVESDGLKGVISTKGAILWMSALRTLLVGTDEGEYSIIAEGGVITAKDMQAAVRPEMVHGSAALQPTHAGRYTLFVSPNGRKIHLTDYDLQSQGWTARDLTFVAEHISKGVIRELHFARETNTGIAVLGDGTLALCQLLPEEQIIAWYRARIASGAVRSAIVTEGPAGSYLWLVVERENGTWFERLDMLETAASVFNMDASVSKPIPENLEIDELDHLEGYTVSVTIDGAVEPQQIVSGGKITLLRSGYQVSVGLPFQAKAKTLPPESTNGLSRGSSQRARRRWAKLFVRLNDSALPLVNGVRLSDRSSGTPLDVVEGRVTGDFGPLQSDYESRGQVLLEQDLPVRSEILAVFGALTEGEV